MCEYRKTYEIRWADLDPNWHMRHSAYADYCTQVRFSYLAENGFPASRFAALGFAPVVFREETRYLREVRMNDSITIDFQVVKIGPQGEWKIVQKVHGADGKVAAIHEIEGAWLDGATRKLRQAPEELQELLRRLYHES